MSRTGWPDDTGQAGVMSFGSRLRNEGRQPVQHGGTAPDPKAHPPVAPDLAATIAADIERLDLAAECAGMLPGDPMAVVLSALGHALATIGSITASHTAALEAALARTQASADAEITRARAMIAAAETESIGHIADAVASASEAALTRRIRVFDRNTALLAAAVLMAAILLAGTGGYLLGIRNARSCGTGEVRFDPASRHSYCVTWLP